MRSAVVGLVALTMSSALMSPVAASEFRVVTEREDFVELVNGRELRRFGIRLQVSPGGDIEGRGFGQQVWGAWEWQSSFFCRDLGYGNTDLGYNCQLVAVRGDTVRFVADEGEGDYADFRLR